MSQDAVVSNAVLDWMRPEDTNVQSQVFLVTFASILSASALLASQPFRTLDDITREMVRDAVLDAVANPHAMQVQMAVVLGPCP